MLAGQTHPAATLNAATAGTITTATATTNTGITSGAAAGRPNILFCLADDWIWPHASGLG